MEKPKPVKIWSRLNKNIHNMFVRILADPTEQTVKFVNQASMDQINAGTVDADIVVVDDLRVAQEMVADRLDQDKIYVFIDTANLLGQGKLHLPPKFIVVDVLEYIATIQELILEVEKSKSQAMAA